MSAILIQFENTLKEKNPKSNSNKLAHNNHTAAKCHTKWPAQWTPAVLNVLHFPVTTLSKIPQTLLFGWDTNPDSREMSCVQCRPNYKDEGKLKA